MTATSPRWDRLADSLAAAGITAQVDSRTFTEASHGRVGHGTTHSITIRHPEGGTVEIEDKWWWRNPDAWLGWEVIRTGADDIVVGRPSRGSKKRGEVVAHVLAKMA